MELMITIGIGAIVLVVFFSAFFRGQDAARRFTDLVEARQGSRSAIQLLEREVRMAGSGWGRTAVEGAYGGAPLTLHALDPGYGGVAGNDSIRILGGWDVATTLRQPMTLTTTTIQVVSTSGFKVGDLCVVSNGASAHMFQVTGVTASPADLAHATTSTFNAAGGHQGFPVGGYGLGASVFKANWVTYYADSSATGRLALMQRTFGQAPEMIGDGVRRFWIRYRMHDGTMTRDPQDLSMIERIVPVLYTQPRSGTAPGTDSLWATVRPRTY
jgi:hypothetical protein